MSTLTSVSAIGFLVKTVLTQLLGVSVVVITWPLLESTTISIALATIVSLVVAMWLELPTPWRILNGLLPVAAAASLAIQIPAWVFLIPFIALATVYAPAFATRVPYYPTPRSAYALLLAELPTDRPFKMIDVGCGMGDLLAFLSTHRPNGTFVGVEVGIVPYLVSRLRSIGRPNLKIRFRSMWQEDFGEYDFVYTFLSPAAMPRVWQKAASEMKNGSTFITNSFPVPAEADEVLKIRNERDSSMYIHRFSSQANLQQPAGVA